MTDFSTHDDRPSTDQERGDLEIEEVWRAAAAAGFDTDVEIESEDSLRCAGCGVASPVGDFVRLDARPARDTASAQTDLAVYRVRCPSCSRLGRTIAPVLLLDRFAVPTASEGHDESSPTEELQGSTQGGDKTPEHPLGDDRRFFDEGHPGNLKDQGSLIDAEGDDVREYTSEPVETEEGWVIARQQTAGPGNIAGGGEFPDPDTPPATEPGVAGHRRTNQP